MLLGSYLPGMLSLGKSHTLEQKGCRLCGLNLLYAQRILYLLVAGKKKIFSVKNVVRLSCECLQCSKLSSLRNLAQKTLFGSLCEEEEETLSLDHLFLFLILG